ncbi:MAG: antitermination protein NusG, partial [Nitrospirae bacterium]|nr:antitermination protein NusG [Nitrospirota bacterium]
MNEEWFVVCVKNKHEIKVANRLIAKGIKTFLPTVERLNRWKDRKQKIIFPLFPCY